MVLDHASGTSRAGRYHARMHRWSKLFIPTLREAPADAEVASHKLLLRAGYVRQLGAGIYSYLFLGNRSINKIVAIIREEMDTIGQEFLLPTLHPRELWEESGRWTAMGANMFRLQDRKGAELCLGMTHEEVMTSIARNELRSYKQLPQIWYQIQTKFRDEPRPKSGLLRVRQFLMKDSYSFDLDDAGLDLSYNAARPALPPIFDRCGLEYRRRRGRLGRDGRLAIAGVYGLHRGRRGPDRAARLRLRRQPRKGYQQACSRRGSRAYGRRPARARSDPRQGFHRGRDGLLRHSRPRRTSSAWPSWASVPAHLAGEPLRPVVAFLRGDHQVNETKLNAVVGTAELRPMLPEELALHIGGPAGFLGPIGIPQVMTRARSTA